MDLIDMQYMPQLLIMQHNSGDLHIPVVGTIEPYSNIPLNWSSNCDLKNSGSEKNLALFAPITA